MRKSPLFNKTRLQIAAWYATGTGLTLILVSCYLYLMLKGSYSTAINREVAALAGTLHDALEPKLQYPGIIDKSIDQEIIPNLCITGQTCTAAPYRHALGVTQQDIYYLRFYNSQQQIIAQSGVQPVGDIAANFNEPWRSIYDAKGNHYQRFSTSLTTLDGHLWGVLQVGRSMKEFDEQLTDLQLKMALILPVLMVFITLISWWVAGRTMKPIYSSYQRMQQFTADAAHELRTPLMAIQATVDLMQYYEPTEYVQQKASLAALDRQTERLIQLAQDLDSPLDQAPVATCCLNQIIPALVKNLQALSQAAEINLDVDITTSASLLVKIDRVHLERLLTNLVSNAIEHTPANGTVTVTLSQSGNQAVLQVIDTGMGMSPAIQARIFDRFYRGIVHRGRTSGGAGLGLAIVKSIASNYGGIVLVQSKLERGSTFIVKLPLSNLKPNSS
jgi:signal transduction histidine kinase